jgi:hypothetical protein
MNTTEKLFNSLSEGFTLTNSGGCGLFAYAVSRALKKAKVEHKIIVFCFRNYQVNKFIEATGKIKNNNITSNYKTILESGKTNNSVHNHIVIEFDGYYYDTDGLYVLAEEPKLCSEINPSVLKKLVQRPKLWNDCFLFFNTLTTVPLDKLTRKALRLVSHSKF